MTKFLTQYSATQSELKEVLEYTKNHFKHNGFKQMPDESFAKFWMNYKSDFEFMKSQIVEFNFPIKEGISDTEEYTKAREQGIFPKLKTDLGLKDIVIDLVETPGGKMPVVILKHRDDFEKVIQCFSGNSEPIKVPKSMGASTYAGYHNWGRINAYKKEWFSLNKDATELEWAQEFEKLKAQGHLYKDSFIVLSNGPYSAVPATALGVNEEEWKRLSLEIRKYHETNHYFTKRVLGSMNNNIIDEILCDFVGLIKATGKYELKWALTFLGLENYPKYRKGGRLENYASVKSQKAKDIIKDLVYKAMKNMSELKLNKDPYILVYALSKFNLVELAFEKDRVILEVEKC